MFSRCVLAGAFRWNFRRVVLEGATQYSYIIHVLFAFLGRREKSESNFTGLIDHFFHCLLSSEGDSLPLVLSLHLGILTKLVYITVVFEVICHTFLRVKL